MTNKEKAEELGRKCGRVAMEMCDSDEECTRSALLMAAWKDEQFAAEKSALMDKVCNWLEEHLYDDEYTVRDNEGTWVDVALIKEALKKAMKGGN